MIRNRISIDDRSSVWVPNSKIMMRDFEIAELFGIMVPTVKGKIKALIKNRHFNGCTYKVVSGNSLIPAYFDLDMVVAVAFSVDSYRADIFRKWIMRKMIDRFAFRGELYILIRDIGEVCFPLRKTFCATQSSGDAL